MNNVVAFRGMNAASAAHLGQAHNLLQELFRDVASQIPILIMDAQRGKAAQEDAFRRKATKVHFPNSAHNWVPSVALDVAPLPLVWTDRKAFRHLIVDIVQPTAKRLKIPIRCGIDFNMNGVLTDDKFVDLPHVELYPWRNFATKQIGA